MKTPNRLDDRFHAGLIAIALCLAIAVIADTPDPTPVEAATLNATQPLDAPTAHNAAPEASARPGQPS